MADLFPIFVAMNNQRCVVVGGGQVAERKVENLLEYSVHIDVISPEATPKLQNWAEKHLINWIARGFQPTDIQEAFLVFAATDDPRVNRKVAGLCQEKGILVNAVDDPAYCDFYIPSTIRRNSLVLAIPTGMPTTKEIKTAMITIPRVSIDTSHRPNIPMVNMSTPGSMVLSQL